MTWCEANHLTETCPEQQVEDPADVPCAYCGAQEMEPCAPDCLSTVED